MHPDLQRTFPPPRVPAAGVHNLTPVRTSFVGRAAELARSREGHRHVLTGHAGGAGRCGKICSANEVGLHVAGATARACGSCRWRASPARRPGGAGQELLGSGGQARVNATEAVCSALAAGPRLIILDNCEHVLNGCVELVQRLLAASDTVRVLVTSREHLGVGGETILRPGPLGFPAAAQAKRRWRSVELFVARAAQSRRGFELTPTNTEVVKAVCVRLDGIALALELAAARLSKMSLSQLHEGLHDALGILGSGDAAVSIASARYGRRWRERPTPPPMTRPHSAGLSGVPGELHPGAIR